MVLSGRHLPAAPRLHCAALHPVAAPHPSPCSPPHLLPPPRLSAKTGSSPTAAWGRTGRRHLHCRRLAVAAADGGGTAAGAHRAPPRRAAAVRAAGRRAAAGASRPSAVARGRRPPAAPHRPPLPPRWCRVASAAPTPPPNAAALTGERRHPTWRAHGRPRRWRHSRRGRGRQHERPKRRIRALQSRPMYLLELIFAAGVEPQRVHRWRGGARVFEGKMGVYSMGEHASFFSFCGDCCCFRAF